MKNGLEVDNFCLKKLSLKAGKLGGCTPGAARCAMRSVTASFQQISSPGGCAESIFPNGMN